MRVSPQSSAPPAPTRYSTAPPAKPSVLIVDDEVQVLVALEDILSDEFIVHTTKSPQEALNLARDQQELAVIISDQRMPKMSGDELLHRACAESDAQRILVTGYADLSGVIRAVNDGRIFAYITKPWDPNDLQLKVRGAAEHYRLARELAHHQHLLQDLMDNIPDGIYFKDPTLRFTRVNEPLARMLGVKSGSSLVGTRLRELSSAPACAEEAETEEEHVIARGAEVIDVVREYGKGEERQWYSETKVAVRDGSGTAIGLVGISRNVTERIEAEKARQRQQQRIARLTRIHAVLSGINSAIVRIKERDALIAEACRIAVREGELALALLVEYRPAARGYFVVSAIQAEGAPALGLAPGASMHEGLELLLRIGKTKVPVVVSDVAKDDELGFSRQFIECGHRALAAFPLSSGDPQHVFVLSSSQPDFFDSDEQRLLAELADNISFALDHIAQAAQLDFLAYYDELTQLPNQRLLLDRLSQQLVTSRGIERKIALVMLDINRFREVNETLGRSGGDVLLREVATRLMSKIGQQDSLARVEGNRFSMLITLVEDEAEVGSLVEDVLGVVSSQSFVFNDTELVLSLRAGISLFPADGTDAETLISNAEAALRKAKLQGRRYVFYAPSMNEKVAEKLTLETRLRQALENEQFLLHYQPKVELRKGLVLGVEALIRWQSPHDGLVPPGVFIPVLEETGLISEVGRWVLMRAAAQYAEWHRAGKNPPRIAVNVSALQLSQQEFLPSVEHMQRTYPDAARGLDLEITESVFVDDFKGNVEKLTAARELGLQVAIDDFGTGYSSLGYLTRLPIDVLKIDRSFVSRMTRDPQDMALVTTVISLAHALDCQVIAEGVEHVEQAQLLRLLKCDQIQGYLISKPVPAEDVAALFGKAQRSIWTQPVD